MSRLIITSMYADPLHVGHVECLEKAKALEGFLLVIVNNDAQAVLKKGFAFMDEQSRLKIVNSIKGVNRAILSIDTDPTVCNSIREAVKIYNYDNFYREIIFAKGGDRFANEIPEAKVCQELGIKIVDGLGAKIDSSSNYYDRDR